MADDLRISMIQSRIIGENKSGNFAHFAGLLRDVSGKTDLALLPETFTTGFSPDAERLADTMDGDTIPTVKGWAKAYGMAIAGSFIAAEDGKYYNRGFFITPDGQAYYYDKRHLFNLSGEGKYFSPGTRRLIVPYKGWNICLMVCYDLRFPVWSRNVDNGYDLLLYVANWPEARREAWMALLKARAIENMAYVCGVNRVGTDDKGVPYVGDSLVFSPNGKELAACGQREEKGCTCTLRKEEMERFRTLFPVWKDADAFTIDL